MWSVRVCEGCPICCREQLAVSGRSSHVALELTLATRVRVVSSVVDSCLTFLCFQGSGLAGTPVRLALASAFTNPGRGEGEAQRGQPRLLSLSRGLVRLELWELSPSCGTAAATSGWRSRPKRHWPVLSARAVGETHASVHCFGVSVWPTESASCAAPRFHGWSNRHRLAVFHWRRCRESCRNSSIIASLCESGQSDRLLLECPPPSPAPLGLPRVAFRRWHPLYESLLLVKSRCR